MAKILILLAIVGTVHLVSASDDVFVRFYYGTEKNYTDYAVESAEEAVSNDAWNSSNKVIVYLHGLNESVESPSAIAVSGAFLELGGWNVLAVDYASQAKYSGNIVEAFAYLVTQSGVVGETVGGLMNRFIAKGVPASSFYLVGYSVGAHVAGHAARTCNGTIDRITGLDPQLHGWFLFGLNDHIWSTDAPQVDIIHSNGVLMGVSTALGTADFYPNSGYALQPGCSLVFNSSLFFCSSDASWEFFSESVTNPTAFEAISCSSWTEFETGTCTGATQYMGYGCTKAANGTYYLQTNSKSPYSLGKKGIIYNSSTMSALSSAVIEFFVSIFSTFF